MTIARAAVGCHRQVRPCCYPQRRRTRDCGQLVRRWPRPFREHGPGRVPRPRPEVRHLAPVGCGKCRPHRHGRAILLRPRASLAGHPHNITGTQRGSRKGAPSACASYAGRPGSRLDVAWEGRVGDHPSCLARGRLSRRRQLRRRPGKPDPGSRPAAVRYGTFTVVNATNCDPSRIRRSFRHRNKGWARTGSQEIAPCTRATI